MRVHPQVHHMSEFWLWVVVTVLAVLLAMVATTTAGGTADVVEPPTKAAIVSPCEGFFYAAETPGEPPLVQIGDYVTEEMIVGYVQTMDKVPIYAATRGTVVEILVEDMSVVATGDVLFLVVE